MHYVKYFLSQAAGLVGWGITALLGLPALLLTGIATAVWSFFDWLIRRLEE